LLYFVRWVFSGPYRDKKLSVSLAFFVRLQQMSRKKPPKLTSYRLPVAYG
jgi:hypothetical protein